MPWDNAWRTKQRSAKKHTRESNKRWRNRLAIFESGNDPRRKKRCLAKALKLKKIVQMIKCFALALYQSRKRRTKKKRRWLNALCWPCTSLAKEGRRRSCSLKIPYRPLRVYLSRSLTLSFTSLFRNKRKSKEADYISMHKLRCLFISVYNSMKAQSARGNAFRWGRQGNENWESLK